MGETGVPHGTMKSFFIAAGKFVSSRWLATVLRVVLGFVFVYASMSKIPYPAQFAEAVAAYRLIPYPLLNAGAIVLPWVEFFCGLFLIIGLRTAAAALITGILLLLFMGMISINMYWGAPINCGCFDTVGEALGWKKLTEDAVLFLFAVQVFYFDRGRLFRGKKLPAAAP